MSDRTGTSHKTCYECGYAAPAGEEWDTVEDVALGSLARCPDCGSTNVQHTR